MLTKDFPWDTVQLPVNLLDAHYRSFARQILPLLSERAIGAIGMKSLAMGDLLKTGISPKDAIGYCLSLPIHTLVCGIDSPEVLAQDLEIVRSWKPLTKEQRQALLDRAAPHAAGGRLEWYKTR